MDLVPAYNPAWRVEDERRTEWMERCYQSAGRRDRKHRMHGLYTGLVEKYGQMPWDPGSEYLPAGKSWRHQGRADQAVSKASSASC